jgi:hypothetical protein
MHRQYPPKHQPNGGAASTKTARNRYGSYLCFERARSRGFEQNAVSTIKAPGQRVPFFKIGESFGRKKSIYLITIRPAQALDFKPKK